MPAPDNAPHKTRARADTHPSHASGRSAAPPGPGTPTRRERAKGLLPCVEPPCEARDPPARKLPIDQPARREAPPRTSPRGRRRAGARGGGGVGAAWPRGAKAAPEL